MEGRKIMIDVKDFELLEQKILKATERMQALRRERDVARLKLQELQEQLDRLNGEYRALEKDRQGASVLKEEVQLLQSERQAIRGRVTRMLEMMTALEEPMSAQADH
jgi:chromosome segregation ATPase